MEILFIAPAGRAGTLQYTHNLANALAARGHSVALATGIDFELDDYPRGYTVIKVFDRIRIHRRRFLELIKYLRTKKPDVIHMQGAQHPEIYLALYYFLKMFSKARVFYTPQDVLSNTQRWYHVLAFKALYKKVRHIFLNAKYNLEPVVERFNIPRSKLSVLPIADLTAFVRESVTAQPPSINPEDKLILCFGLIERRKGIKTLIDAAPFVFAKSENAIIHIVGKPYESLEPYHQQINDLGVANRVKIVDQYVSFEEMSGYFQRASVIVLPYESGWNSGVLASAIGFEKVIVATRVAGFDEVIEDGVNGLLVEAKSPEGLARGLTNVLNNAELFARLEQGVKLSAKKYSWDEIAQEIEAQYQAGMR